MTHEMLLQNLTPSQVLDVYGRLIPVDLSVSNPEIASLDSADDFEIFISEKLRSENAVAAYGGYMERRNLYRGSELFNDDDAVRDVHIGLDIWAPAKTSVHAPLTGSVHSFDYNTGTGNYGPTIILEHKIENLTFYTLYGHLSIDSIAELEIGDIFGPGQKIGTLGDKNVNGGYAPHLHFQIIIDMEGNEGDYPGVCSEKDRDHYRKNCPDPNLLLKIN